jgi:hypothetical protein
VSKPEARLAQAQAHGVEGDHDLRSADNILCIVPRRSHRNPVRRANHRPTSRRDEIGKRVVACDELELHFLRTRFLAVSEQITSQLAGLAQRISVAPPDTRASLLMLAAQIVAAQQRLQNETDRLVGHPAERAAILQITLQAQLAVSCQLDNILRTDHALSHLGTKLADIAEQLAQANRSAPSPTGRQTWEDETEHREHNDLSIVEANAWPRHPIALLAPSGDEETFRSPDDNLSYPVTLSSRIAASLTTIATDASPRSLALAAFLLCGLVVAYARLSGGDQHELATRLLPASEPKVTAVPRVRLPLAQPQKSLARAAHATATLPDAEAAHGQDPDVSVSAAAPDTIPPPSTANTMILNFPGNVGPASQVDNWEGTVASTQRLAASKSTRAIPSYVPVVLTHKDKDTAKRSFAELQLRYPKLLHGRQSELQEVNAGEKGVWYRVFLLPQGTRQQATASCAALAAAGHDHCWVKEY